MANDTSVFTNKTIGDFIDTSKPVVSCEDLDDLPEVMKKLVDNNILSMPVYSHATGEYIGLVGMLEIVKLIADLHWQFIQSPKPYREAEIYVEFNNTKVSQVFTQRQVKIHSTSSFVMAVQSLIQAHLRRLPVVDSDGKVVYMVTETQIVAWLYDALVSSNGITGKEKSVLEKPITELDALAHLKGKSETDLFSLSKTGRTDSKLDLEESNFLAINGIAKAIEAFRVLVSTGASAVPIVDFDQKILGTVSVRDIRRIASNAENVSVLYREDAATFSKRAWAARVRSIANLPPIEDQVVDDDGFKPLIFVTLKDSVKTVLTRFHQNQMHRVWVVDEKSRPIGVVTLKDIVELLV